MPVTELPIDARAFDDLSNNGFVQVSNAVSMCVCRGDLEFRYHIKGRHIDVAYRDRSPNVFGISTCRILMPSEVLREDIVEDFEIVCGDAVIQIERQRDSFSTLQRIAGAIEACMPKK
ncbi:hypothetical protein MPK66_gp264 [Erwinia phage pEa_SNUABM_2]|uniref:Uncharacterized protein n=1 Tax=Erwinia phage pEa_SNUABM_2 TaxID=2869547 RepID=A0AAE7XQ17_9CAUD|nr:hypothetical protein MPK66_gp264 [Erwinia phage pEa_SNUABM_2]QZE59508.1 hypothetical protein pEaSNUABM2_00264 [Erwinia phage pEa_SNUABM_2]QZE59845.1 hypothetical protein pEaSNUABM39_00265 [Erwinia phage pEa_SNUABM_39]